MPHNASDNPVCGPYSRGQEKGKSMTTEINSESPDDKQTRRSSHCSSSATLVSAMRILANDIQSDDGIANAAIAEAADRIEQLEANMERLQSHADKLVAIATNVVRKSHRNDLYFIDCLRVDAASSLRLALVELSDYLREW